MEALDSPPERNLENEKNNTDCMYESKSKEDNCISDSVANKELQCDEDDKVVHQNNTNLELQKQKLIRHNVEDEDFKDQHPMSYSRSSSGLSYGTQTEQENYASPKNVDSEVENQDNIDRAIDLRLDTNDSKDYIDTENRNENSTENVESSFFTNFSETSIETCESDAPTSDRPRAFQSDVVEGVDMKPILEYLPFKQTCIEPGEADTMLREYESDSASHATKLKYNCEESAETGVELLISSPKINGNHKEVHDTSCNSIEQDISVEGGLEIEKSDRECEVNQINKEGEFQHISCTGDSPFTGNKPETCIVQENKIELPLNLNKSESRCSTPNSTSSSSTTHSSSSQQLVIDQPTDEEKISTLRLTIKTKRNKTAAKKQSRPRNKSNTGNKKGRGSKSSTLNLSQNVTEQENANFQDSQFAKAETETQFIYTLSSSLNEGKGVNDMDINTVMLAQESPIPHTEESLQKDAIFLSCDCNKTIGDSLHLHTCPSYKSIAPNYYKCTSCGTYHENWSFFLHIREQHDRFLCLYCIKCFPTAEKLSLHLEIKHDLEQNHFNSEESFRGSATVVNGYALETRFLMCCTCQHVFGERVAFTEHICMEYMKSCVLCGQKGRHTNQCKAHPFVKRRNKKKVKEKQSLQALPTATDSMTNVQEETSTQCQSITMKPTTHNEDSNSSSNMVIDESCTTNHCLSGKLIAFNTSKEQENSEKQQELSPQISLEKTVNANKNFLKFKLRVPKEFQKPVDAVMSSSESDDGVYEEEIADGNNQQNVSVPVVYAQDLDSLNLEESKPEQLSHTDSNESGKSEHDEKLSKTECDEESIDEEDSNPHLARLLEEIEQTKLDIKRTKETIHHAHSHKLETTPKKSENHNAYSIDHADEQNPVCLASMEGSPKRTWTPTPPASPKATENNIGNEQLIHETTVEENTNENSGVEAFNGVGNEDISLTKMQCDQHSIESDPTDSLENVDNMDNIDGYVTNTQDISQDEAKEEEEETVRVLCETNSDTQLPSPSDGIEIANEDCLLIEIQLDRPIEKYETVEFVRTCLKAAYPFCLYCNHARRIAVNGESLVLHLIAQHRFSATVDSITAEELQPETIVARLKSFLPELQNEFFNTSSYCTIGAGAFTRHFNERIFECFQCRFVTTTHKELYLHNRKMHLRTAILCFMCRCNFFSFSEILCHICPGVPHKVSIFEIKFRCCLCDLENIPSPFRLMVHLRKRHFACDICLEDCRDQSKLSSHVWKHKLHHLCYRCGIAYRNKMDITKHLFWKHGTESDICKRCLNKRWPHVYHFCVPPQTFICEVCQHCFTKAMYLTVHKRIHLADFRYPCTEENCEEKFISRKLLLKHTISHQTFEKGAIKDNDNVCDTSKIDANLLNEVSKVEPEDATICDADNKQPEDDEAQTDQKIKEETESYPQSEKNQTDETKSVVLNAANELDKPPQKRKKKKRAKESLEDLNLTAPNLSESGSSSDSESETKSKYEEEEPKVVPSPSSEHGDAKEQKLSEIDEGENPGNVLDIWKNFLQAQQAQGAEVEVSQLDDMDDDIAAVPKSLHVAYSDHDYCKLFNPISSQASPQDNERSKSKKSFNEKKRIQSLQRPSSRNSNATSSSSDESSDTSSSSSCSCGPNCSCSPGSSSSSSSSSSENSDSSAASRKRQRKKSERNIRHRKSESISPRKNHSVSEIVNVMETDDNAPFQGTPEMLQPADIEMSAPLSESLVHESDLETAESETDEEYYDEHPQKFASELLSQKRAQLMARTFLSPSHNFDIVENSRPSTPSLPEDVVYEKRKKKKKRDRKSTSKSNILPPKFQINQTPPHNSNLESSLMTDGTQMRQLEAIQSQYLALGENFAEVTATSLPQVSVDPVTQQRNFSHLGTPRISEGSSCSDVDGSLKRSKRARRPNKFYGYTSDDESMASAGLGQSLLIGMRTFKPQPPPQLIWNKEDLPTPSKSILNSKKTPRAQKRTEADLNADISTPDYERLHGPLPKKKKTPSSSLQSLNRKRSKKLPPIPRLKIRPALFGMGNSGKVFKNDYVHNSLENTNQLDNGSHRATVQYDDDSSDASSQDGHNQTWNNPTQPPRRPLEHYQVSEAPQISTKPALPPITTPLPPTPQTTVFNHKIPPALLPNPDFATLQYFKANNIRYPIRPPAGARAAREGESVYCYCRCPYDEVSEMIACDGDNCLIEWFHFECVGIMVAPQGKWFCAECRPHYSEDLYPQSTAPNLLGTLRDH